MLRMILERNLRIVRYNNLLLLPQLICTGNQTQAERLHYFMILQAFMKEWNCEFQERKKRKDSLSVFQKVPNHNGNLQEFYQKCIEASFCSSSESTNLTHRECDPEAH